jgi:hypothetical protein
LSLRVDDTPESARPIDPTRGAVVESSTAVGSVSFVA